MHKNIEPKIQNMSKIQVLRMIIYEGVQKKIQGGFIDFHKNFTSSILINAIVRLFLMELKMKVRTTKRKLGDDYNEVPMIKH